MRVKFELESVNTTYLDLYYHYNLSKAIYKLFQFNSSTFKEFLKDSQFVIEPKKLNFYTFGLIFDHVKVIEKSSLFFPNGNASLIVSFPDFSQYFQYINNQLSFNSINIGKTEFSLNNSTIVDTLDVSEMNDLKLLSPMVMSTTINIGEKQTSYYLRYFDDIADQNACITNHLRRKYFLLYGKQSEGVVEIEWDEVFIKHKESIRKKLTYNLAIECEESRIQLIGNKLPFSIKGDKDLIQLGFDCGFGEKTSYGFGIVDHN